MMIMENHAVCIPFPVQGHLKPMLILAELLHTKFGFHITLINTLHNGQTFFQSASSTDDTHTFIFESIPEGVDGPKDIMSLINSIQNKGLQPSLKELLSKLCDKDYCLANNIRPVTCMISDVAMSSFTLDVAEEMGMPAVVLETASACGFMAYLHYRQLLDKGIIPLPDDSCLTNGYLNTLIDGIPSMIGLRLRDMPAFVRTTGANDQMLNIPMSNAYSALKARAILINTFDELEQKVLRDLSTVTLSPKIYPIGPLQLLLDQKARGKISTSYEEDHRGVEIMQWLDSQEPNTVLYVSFGTSTVMNQEQLLEFAWGLANSHKKFLWIVRYDLVSSGPISLPPEFKEEIIGRGLLASWCDQERVLAHPSVGGFLTHCGWNSMIESISHGVPMICWPFFAEQFTNCWYCCNHFGIGVEISEMAVRDEVERMVKELMQGEKGKEMKKKAMEWRKLAREATMSTDGSSYGNLESVINNILLP